MDLFISTADRETITLRLSDGKASVEKTIAAHRLQADALLPAIEKILAGRKRRTSDITAITVEEAGDSFTALRIGVATANALGYALGCRVRGVVSKALKKRGIAVVAPAYSKPPTIHKKK